MNNNWIYFFPFISAIAGWLLSRLGIFLFFNVLKAKQHVLANNIGNYAATQVSLDEITQKLTNTEAVEKILPFAEQHIDNFLRNKLPAAMPMLAMFISDKLVADMKAIFMLELKELFPSLIGQYVENAKASFNISKVVADKFATFNINYIKTYTRKYLLYVEIFGAIIGFTTSIIWFLLTRVA